MSQARRMIGFAALALVAFLLGAWAFAAYLRPEMAFDFAALLQMCGIPITK